MLESNYQPYNSYTGTAIVGSLSINNDILWKYRPDFVTIERVVDGGSDTSYPLNLLNLGNGIVICGISMNQGTSSRLIRSTDYGKTWTANMVFTGMNDVRAVGTIGNGICFVGVIHSDETYRKLYVSRDYGLTWKDLGSIYSANQYYPFVYLGNGKIIVWGGSSPGLLYSSDYGETWSQKGNSYSLTNVYGMYKIGKYLYLIGKSDTYTGYVVMRSSNDGDNWSVLTSSSLAISEVCYCYDSGVLLIVSTDGLSLYLSMDMGCTLTPIKNNLLYRRNSMVYCGNGRFLVPGCCVDSGYLQYIENYGEYITTIANVIPYGDNRIYSPLVLEDGTILFSGYPTGNIYRLSSYKKDVSQHIQNMYTHISWISDILGTPRLLIPVWYRPTNGSAVLNASGYHRISSTVYDYSRNTNNLTCPFYVDSVPSFIGEVTAGETGYIDFNGSTHYLYRTNDIDFDFGNSTTDSAFSVVCCLNPDNVDSRFLIGKWDENNLREWRLFLNDSGYPTFQLYDESVDTYIGRVNSASIGTGTWKVLIATYNGSGISAGCKLYIDGVQVDDADYASGTYEAMEAVTANLMVGAKKNNTTYSEYYDGKMTWIGITAKELSADEVWSLTQRLKGVLGV